MTRLEILKKKLDDARCRQMALYRAGNIIEGRKMTTRIEAIEEQLREAEKYVPQPLSKLADHETLRKYRVSEKMIEMHLASDYLADCAFDLRETLKKLGFVDCSLFPIVDEICKSSQRFANMVCEEKFAGLKDFIVNNDGYIDSLHGFTKAYMNSKLVVT